MEPKLLSVLFILFVQLGKLTFHKALLRKAIFAELIKICLGLQKMHKTITDDDEAADQTLHDEKNNECISFISHSIQYPVCWKVDYIS